MVKLPRPIDDTTERKSMGFDIPNGEYLLKVLSCEDKEPKKGGDKYLAVELEVMDAAREKGENAIGFKVFEQFSFSKEAEFRIVAFLDACFPPKFKGDNIPETILDKMLIAETREEEYQGYKRPRCRSFKAAANWHGLDIKINEAGVIENAGSRVDNEKKAADAPKTDGKSSSKTSGTEVAF